MKKVFRLVGLVALLVSLLAGGCVSNAEYETLQADLEDAVTEMEAVQAELEALQANYNQLDAELEGMATELVEIMEIYPPGDFSSVTELEEWVSNHIQPKTPYLDGSFRSALKVQSQGLEDGYLISVMYDENDTNPDTGWIFCGALANGHFYIWGPEFGEVHSWYADWLCK